MNEVLEDKYYDLLLKRCLEIKDSLFISTNKICLKYANRIVEKARSMGINDVYLNITDSIKVKEHLYCTDISEMDNDPFFNMDKWNEYALKGAAFLMLKTELPGIMQGVSKDKIIKMGNVMLKNQSIYKELQLSYKISWTIACLPNSIWADTIFPNNENSEELLFDYICKMCMVDEISNPIDNWNRQLEINSKMVDKLNALNIKSLSYKGSNGTDLTIGFSDRRIWKGTKKRNFIVNMPSYEIFTSPSNKSINGIVYSTKPLMYNGTLIDEFYLKFKDGKAVEAFAKKGNEALNLLIKSCKNADSLGEVALVSADSPIAKSNICFSNTLYDENASSHLALGHGFPICIDDYDCLTQEEIENLGFNISTIHVDFMVGGTMLDIVAKTYDDKEILIMKNGLFVI